MKLKYQAQVKKEILAEIKGIIEEMDGKAEVGDILEECNLISRRDLLEKLVTCDEL